MDGLLKDFSHYAEEIPEQELTAGFSRFCEKMATVFEVKDFLLSLYAYIPKKFKISEIALFYESPQLGLRRAYVNRSRFYESVAKKPWPKIHQSCPGSLELSFYLAEELGRPFSKSLMIPLFHSKRSEPALLVVETGQWRKSFQALIEFFELRRPLIHIAFNRVLMNAYFERVSYLWSQLFECWGEPLAVLQNFKAVRWNDSFKEDITLPFVFPHPQKEKSWIETKNKIYQAHYYPISKMETSIPTGILYCQDMTKHFRLREELFQSEKMASLCNLGKNMAHQLNNPLTGIQSMAQILLKNSIMSNFKEEWAEVEKAARRSQKIIDSLLSFSQTGGQATACDLNQVVADTLPLLKNMTQGLEMKVDFCQQDIKVQGDFALLKQVVYNLVLNSCQALKQDKQKALPRIQISIYQNLKDQACLKIQDNGPGIASQNLKKIFQPFWTNKDKGTGWGLGIVQQFVQKFHGEILVSSKEKELTCFTVLLPLIKPLRTS